MAFINEIIPADDMAKYGIEAINAQWNKMNSGSQWTIDRNRDIYLRLVFKDREEMGLHRKYNFYWKGTLINLKLALRDDFVVGGEGWVEYTLLTIAIPDSLDAERDAILADLSAALTVLGSDGVYGASTSTQVILNF